MLYNLASIYASLGAAENRAEIEGIKRALAYMQVRLVPLAGPLKPTHISLPERSRSLLLHPHRAPPRTRTRTILRLHGQPKSHIYGPRHDPVLSRRLGKVLPGRGTRVFLAAGRVGKVQEWVDRKAGDTGGSLGGDVGGFTDGDVCVGVRVL